MKKLGLFLILNLLLVMPSHARSLSLDEALSYAVERNEDAAIAELSVEKIDYLIKEIRSTLYPTLNLNAQYMLFHAQKSPHALPFTGTPFEPLNAMNEYNTHGFTGGVGVELHQLIYSFGVVKLALETAQLSKNLMDVQKDAAIMNLRFSIRNAYFATLVYEENYKIAQQSYNNALNTKSKLARSASVRTSQSDLIKVDADIASRKPVVDNAKLMLDQGYRMLQVLCVLDEPITSLSTKFSDLPLPKQELTTADLLSLLPESPILKSLEMAVDLDYNSAKSKTIARRPSLSLVGNYSVGISADNPNIFSESDYSGEGAIGIYASIPIFDGNKAKNQARQDEVNARIGMQKLQQTQRQLENALTDAFATYQTKIQTLKMDDAAIRLAERSYQMSLSRFLNGQTSATELNSVEQGLTMLRMSRMGTLNAIYASLAQIEQIIGEL